MKPQCPHCLIPLDSWPRAKIHVKFCRYGPHAREYQKREHLNCVFCGETTFQNFAELSVHVKTQCPGRMPESQKTDGENMNVGKFVQGTGQADRLPLLDPKLFKKLAKKGVLVGKMIACRQVKTPKFEGLAMDFKNGTTKFAFLSRFDRWDITALVNQLHSEDTDDWIGENVRFVAKKSTQGQTFVNVELPKRKPAKK